MENSKKKYLNIKEASTLLNLEEHTIRYWDSIDPKTSKLRVEGISTRSNKGTRYFNRENIKKLSKLKALLYEDGVHNHSFKIADKIISSTKNIKDKQKNQIVSESQLNPEKQKKLRQILKNMREIIEN
tara:strand:- start:1 stop:384 length:384 start_codon:yes stop_codon:yes gene_type:complete